MDTAADSDAGATVQVRCAIQLFSSVIYVSAETAFALGSLFGPGVRSHAGVRPTTPSLFARLLFCYIPDTPALDNILTLTI
jgi:hypothetical protein